MKPLIKPKKLQRGDKVATISFSFGAAGAFLHKYEQGKRQLQETFGVAVVETTNALKSADYIYKNPKARAEDLMEAFSDPSIKAIISNVGGEDSIRTLPFTDLSVIENNPKIFLGFSDTTITHFALYKGGITSFYGTALMVGFAENGGMHSYQIQDIERTLFSSKPVGQVVPNPQGWTSEFLDWNNIELQSIKRTLTKSKGWNFLQGRGKSQGRLMGGCLEVLEFLKGTDYWLSKEEWQDVILFIETAEVMMPPENFRWIVRNYAAQGILPRLKGLIMGRPYDNKYTEEYNKILLQVISEEEGLESLPIITEMDFGHTCPTFTLPYGVMAEIDSSNQTFSIVESGVTE